jgi:hypothetical protein
MDNENDRRIIIQVIDIDIRSEALYFLMLGLSQLKSGRGLVLPFFNGLLILLMGLLIYGVGASGWYSRGS